MTAKVQFLITATDSSYIASYLVTYSPSCIMHAIISYPISKHPAASGGRAPRPPLQRSTSWFKPPTVKFVPMPMALTIS